MYLWCRYSINCSSNFKIRFFISLLIDQKDNPVRPNRGVLSLPNLETNLL